MQSRSEPQRAGFLWLKHGAVGLHWCVYTRMSSPYHIQNSLDEAAGLIFVDECASDHPKFLQEPPHQSTVSYNVVLFSSTSCPAYHFHRYHPSMYVEDKSKDTMTDMYVVWVSMCMCAAPKGTGARGDSQRVPASEQGPLEAKWNEKQCKAPGSHPDGRSRAPYHPHWGGLDRALIWAVTSRLSPIGLSFNGDVCVCWKRQKQTDECFGSSR